MKLVETDIEHEESPSQGAPPPRPEHRKVHASLLITLIICIATVVAVYVVFPERHNEIITVAVEEHVSPRAWTLESPDLARVDAWARGALGDAAPWPQGPDLAIIGVRITEVLRRPAAIVRYRVDGIEVTLMATRARDAPPRKTSRERNGLYARSWRRGKWTFVAVGPAQHSDHWGEALDVP